MKHLCSRATQKVFDDFFSFSECEEGEWSVTVVCRALPVTTALIFLKPESSDVFPTWNFSHPGLADWEGTGAPQTDVTRFRVDF